MFKVQRKSFFIMFMVANLFGLPFNMRKLGVNLE